MRGREGMAVRVCAWTWMHACIWMCVGLGFMHACTDSVCVSMFSYVCIIVCICRRVCVAVSCVRRISFLESGGISRLYLC